MTDRPQHKEPSGAQRMFGDFAPALVGFTDEVLFGQVWTRPQLSPKQRSLVTVAALTAMGAGIPSETGNLSTSPRRTLPTRTSWARTLPRRSSAA